MRHANRVLLLSTVFLFASSISAEPPYTSESSNLLYTVNSVKRNSDDTVTIKGIVKNTSSESVNLCTGTIECSQGYGFPVKIHDIKAKKEYGPMYVDNKRIVGSNHEGENHLTPASELKFWVKISAPPADVATVTLIMPGSASPIDDVQLQ